MATEDLLWPLRTSLMNPQGPPIAAKNLLWLQRTSLMAAEDL